MRHEVLGDINAVQTILISDWEEKMNFMEDEIAKLRNSEKETCKRTERLTELKEIEKTNCEMLTEQKRKLENEIECLRTENDALKETNKSFLCEAHKSEKILDNILLENDQLRKDVENTTDQNEQMEKDIHLLCGDNATLQTDDLDQHTNRMKIMEEEQVVYTVGCYEQNIMIVWLGGTLLKILWAKELRLRGFLT